MTKPPDLWRNSSYVCQCENRAMIVTKPTPNLWRRLEIIKMNAPLRTGIWYALGAAMVYAAKEEVHEFNGHAMTVIKWIKEWRAEVDD
jgi:hypothetical protein